MAPVQITALSDLPTAPRLGEERVAWLITPENWFELGEVLRVATERGLGLDLELDSRMAADRPLQQLECSSLLLVYEVLREWWARFYSAAEAGVLGPDAHQLLLRSLRASLRGRLDDGEAPGETLARLSLPGLDHVLMANHDEAAAFWRVVFWSRLSEDVGRAVLGYATAPGAERHCLRRPWMRILCQKLVLDRAHSEVLDLLRRLYLDRRKRRELLEEELAFGERCDLRELVESYSDSLGLQQSLRRSRAFRLSPGAEPDAGNDPQVTVLIPSYCHAEHIAETLESVFAQTYPDYRVLVADDRSNDDTVEVARSFADPRLTVTQNPENLGLGNSVLAALEEIDTPFVALLNSDDLFHPARLERAMEVFTRSPDCQLVTTDLALIDAESKRLSVRNVSSVLDGKNVYDWVHWFAGSRGVRIEAGELFGELLERNFLVTSSNIICRREFLLHHADALRSLKYCLDWQIFLEAARTGVLVHLSEQLLAYRLHAANTVWFDREKRWRYSLEVNRVAARAIREHVQAAPEEGGERAARALADIGDHLVQNTETGALGLYVNELLGGYYLDQQCEKHEEIADRVAALGDRFAPPVVGDADPAQRTAEIRVILLRDEVAALGGQRDWLAQEVERLRSLEHGLREELGAQTQSSVQLQQRLDELQEELRCRRREAEELVVQLESQRGRLADQQAQLEELRSDLSQAKAETVRVEATLSKSLDAERALRGGAEDRLFRSRVEQRWRAPAPCEPYPQVERPTKWSRRVLDTFSRSFARIGVGRTSQSMVLVPAPRTQAGLRTLKQFASDASGLGVAPVMVQVLCDRAARRDTPAELEGIEVRTTYCFREQYQVLERFWRRRAPDQLEELRAALEPRFEPKQLEALLTPHLAMARSVRAWRPRLVFAAGVGDGGVAARVVAALLQVPLVLCLDRHSACGRPEQQWLLENLPRIDLILARVPQSADLPGNGEATFYPETGRSLESDAAQLPPVLRSLGTPSAQLGWLDLLHAAGLLREGGLEFRMQLVGKADEGWWESLEFDERVRYQIEVGGLSDVVERLEEVPEPAAEIYLSGARDEAGTSAVHPDLIGAQAAGIATLVTDAVHTEHLAPGAEVVPQRDPTAIAEALARMLKSEQFREEVGARGAESYSRSLKPGAARDRMRARLQELLESRSTATGSDRER